jgi:hypothetical protein
MKRALVLVVLLACSKGGSQPAAVVEAWSVADYQKAGLDISKPWHGDDFTHAAEVITSAAGEHRERLPHFRGAASGAVFAKLLEDLPDDSAQPITQRYQEHLKRYLAINTISKLYIEGHMLVPPREYIELLGALLREATVETRDTDAFLATFGPDDPSREVRLGGLAKMKTGFGMMLQGAFLVVANLQVPEDDRVALVTHVTAALPTLFPIAPAGTQQAIRQQVATLASTLPPGRLHDAVVAAQRALPN